MNENMTLIQSVSRGVNFTTEHLKKFYPARKIDYDSLVPDPVKSYVYAIVVISSCLWLCIMVTVLYGKGNILKEAHKIVWKHGIGIMQRTTVIKGSV